MTVTTHESYLNSKYFNSLNGIRCIAIIAVIGYHFRSIASKDNSAYVIIDHLFERGLLGVNLFFVVSGFLITLLLLREHQKSNTIGLKNFYIRRALRIFPAYYLILFVYILILPSDRISKAALDEFFRNLPFFLTYTSNWFVESTAVFSFAWSLATEEQFYLVWPHILKNFTKKLAITFICLAIILNQLALFKLIPPISILSESQNLLLLKICEFISTPICFGALLAIGLQSKGFFNRISFLNHKFASPLIFAILLFAIYAPNEWTPGLILIINLLMTAFVASCVYRQNHGLATILTSKPFFYIGTVSYGMYLINIWILGLMRNLFYYLNWTNLYIQLILCLLVILLIASMSYYFYESRFLSLKTKFQS